MSEHEPNASIKTDYLTRERKIAFVPSPGENNTLDFYQPIFLTDEQIDLILSKDKDTIRDILNN